MKILCQACAAKYTIADEKVVGKVIKIKCKKCGAPIVVNGNDPAALAAATAPPDDDDGGATRVVQQAPDFSANAAPANEWTVSVTDDDQRTMTTEQIADGYRAGHIPGDAFVWRDGMTDWLPLASIPEIMSVVGAANSAPAYQAPIPAAPATTPGLGYAPAAAMAAAPAAVSPFAATAMAQHAAPAAQAARRAGGRGGNVDLFGGGPAAANASASVGERNENSVLFSIGALKAAEEQARLGDARPAPPRGGARNNTSDARVDDIFGLGSGPAGPILAPPPMMAPVIEPPPPPPPPPVAMAPMGGGGPGYGGGGPYGGAAPYGAMAASTGPMSVGYPSGASPYSTPPKKGAPIGIIVGVLVGILLVGGGAAAFALTRGSSKTDAGKTADTSTSQPAAASDDTSKATAGTTSKPDEMAKADTPSDTSKPDTSTTDTAKAADTGKVASNTPRSTGSGADPKKPDTTAKADPTSKPDTTTKPDPTPTATSKPDDTKKPDDSGGAAGTAEFDRGAAGAALSARAGAASGCHKDGDPTGSASVSVTFAPSGHVAGVSVGAPFGGTPTGNCIAGAFHGASVPPFSGSPVTVPKHVSIH